MEMALMLPVLLGLAMGVGEYGYFIHVKSALQESAQRGAREAIQSSATDASVRSAVDSVMTAAGFQSTGYTVTTTPASIVTISTGTNVTVTVQATWGNFGVHMLATSMGGLSAGRQIVVASTMARE
jgi:Flp pilus assembly protein TadG